MDVGLQGIHQGLPDVIPVNGTHPSGEQGDVFTGLFEALIYQARRVDPVDHDPDVPALLADEGLRLGGNPLGQPFQGVAHPGCGLGVPAVSGFDQPGRLGCFDTGPQDLMVAVVVLVPEGILDFRRRRGRQQGQVERD